MGTRLQVQDIHSVRRPRPGPVFLCVLALAGLGLWGCGDEDEGEAETPYGTAAEVREYRRQLEPVIVEVNDIEMEVHRTAVGSSGQATAANLAAAFERLRPRLQAVLEAADQIAPPPLLGPLHQDIRRLIALRLEAFDTLLEGWSTANEDLYQVAEDRLSQANALIPELNEELESLDMAMIEAGESNPIASGKPGPALFFRVEAD